MTDQQPEGRRLADDTCRCLGDKPSGPCEQRRQCARYNDRDNYNAGTPFARWLCGPFDNDHIIRHEKTQPIQTTWRHS